MPLRPVDALVPPGARSAVHRVGQRNVSSPRWPQSTAGPGRAHHPPAGDPGRPARAAVAAPATPPTAQRHKVLALEVGK